MNLYTCCEQFHEHIGITHNLICSQYLCPHQWLMQGKWEVDLQSAVTGILTAECVSVGAGVAWGYLGLGKAVQGYHRAL